MRGVGVLITRRRTAVLAIAAAMFTAIFVLRLVYEDVDAPLILFAVVPIAMIAIEFGAIAGFFAGFYAYGLFVAFVLIADPANPPGVFAYLIRAVVCITLGVSLGYASDRLKASRRRTESIIDSAQEAFISMDASGHITAWNPASERTFGWPAEEVLGKRLSEVLIPEKMRADHERGLRRFFETGDGPFLGKPVETRAQHRSGHQFPVELSISAVNIDRRWIFHGFIRDISERAELLKRIRDVAHTDELTGIANRRHFDQALRREIAVAKRTGEPLCVAVIDIDHFKAFNDSRGHLAGNALLRGASSAWTEALRETDLLARFGGEEFACLFARCSLDVAMPVVERLRAATPRDVTVSAGVASWEDGESPEALFGRADTALYEAKRTGRDRTCVATKTATNTQ